jgi:hypothetical protein
MYREDGAAGGGRGEITNYVQCNVSIVKEVISLTS